MRDATFSRQSLVQTVSVGWDVPGEICKILGFRKNIQGVLKKVSFDNTFCYSQYFNRRNSDTSFLGHPKLLEIAAA